VLHVQLGTVVGEDPPLCLRCVAMWRIRDSLLFVLVFLSFIFVLATFFFPTLYGFFWASQQFPLSQKAKAPALTLNLGSTVCQKKVKRCTLLGARDWKPFEILLCGPSWLTSWLRHGLGSEFGRLYGWYRAYRDNMQALTLDIMRSILWCGFHCH